MTATRAQSRSLAKYEPARGCYLGAYIDFDSGLGKPAYLDQNRTEHHLPETFERIVGKRHAMYFFYMGYGRPLPMDWVRALARRNKLVHIALEPNAGLQRVVDDAYLRRLADDMRASGARIFLRFASEMNGKWTNYSRNPTLYRRKFRLLARVMRQRAPNVAMVWCPFVWPSETIPAYYPGDDAVDWVGINFYSVTYHDNDPERRADDERPVDLLSPIYRRYASRKPIMICEFAATHRSVVDNADRWDFAVSKIRELYRALPRRFPRVKCINYFDGNNLAFVPDRTLNDYSVTNHPLVLAAYREAVAQPHYLSQVQPAPGPLPGEVRERLAGAPPASAASSARPSLAVRAIAASGARLSSLAAALSRIPPALLWIGAGLCALVLLALWQIVALIRLHGVSAERSRAVVLRAIR